MRCKLLPVAAVLALPFQIFTHENDFISYHGSLDVETEDDSPFVEYDTPDPYYSYPYYYDDYGNLLYYPYYGYDGMYLEVGVAGDNSGHNSNSTHVSSNEAFANRFGGRRHWNGNGPNSMKSRGVSNQASTRNRGNGFHGSTFNGGFRAGGGGRSTGRGGHR